MNSLDQLLRALSRKYSPCKYVCKIADTEKKAKAWGVKLGDHKEFVVYPRRIIW